MNHVVKKQQGFTIVELMLAMTFIAFLLLAIALTIIQIGSIYNKGTTLKEINQASRDINDDLKRTIGSAGSLKLASDYILTPSAASPAGGRLCLGSYSYIWNYAKAIASNDVNLAKYQNPPTGSAPSDPIRLVKVPDSSKLYCTKSGGALTNKDIRGVDVSQAHELLKTGDHELGLHQLNFLTPVPASAADAVTGQQIYSITYTIGTSKIPALNATQSACLAANLANADPLYCDVEQFSLVVRTGYGG
jgi:type II secretory pathway pseudopilin PulG